MKDVVFPWPKNNCFWMAKSECSQCGMESVCLCADPFVEDRAVKICESCARFAFSHGNHNFSMMAVLEEDLRKLPLIVRENAVESLSELLEKFQAEINDEYAKERDGAE